MSLVTRIEYDSYIPAASQPRPPLTEREKIRHEGEQRTFHVCALFFLLAHLNLQPDVDRESLSMSLNDVGRLGHAIAEGTFQCIDDLATNDENSDYQNLESFLHPTNDEPTGSGGIV